MDSSVEWKDLLRFLKDDKNLFVEWKNVDLDGLESIFKEKLASFDIDFIGLTGEAGTIFSHPDIARFFGNNQGQFYLSARKDKVRNSTSRHGLIFAECDRYCISALICNENLIPGWETIEINKMNSKLGHLLRGEQLAFRSFARLMQELDINITIYKYGQKMSIQDFEALIQHLPYEINIDIAIGMEIGRSKEFWLVDSSKFKNLSDCYSLMLSSSGCNLLLKGEQKSKILYNNSYRFIY